MNLVKKILIALISLILLAVIAIGILVATVDPNEHRDKITGFVQAQTGRELTLGEIELSIFPHLGLSLEKARLSNAPGFGDTPFATVDQVQLGVAILPLLQSKLEVDTLTLKGLNLDLQRNKEGVTNWDDLVAKAPSEEEKIEDHQEREPGQAMQKLAALSIGGLDIRDGRISWKDDQNEQTVTLAPFSLTSGAITFGEFFTLKMNAVTEVSKPQLSTELNLSTDLKIRQDGQIEIRNFNQKNRLSSESLPVKQVTTELTLPGLTLSLADKQVQLPALTLNYDVKGAEDFALKTAQGRLNLENPTFEFDTQKLHSGPLTLTGDFTGETLPGGKASLSLKTQPELDLSQQTAALKAIRLKALNLSADGNVQVTQLKESPKVRAQLSLAETNLRRLMQQLGLEIDAVDKMSDPKALTRASADLQIDYDTGLQRLNAKRFKLTLDDSTLNGSGSLQNFDKPNIGFNLTLDKIKVDRYLPPKPKTELPEKTPPESEDELEVKLPVEMLRTLTIDGTLKAGQVVYDNLKPKNIVATLKAKDGLFNLTPLTADLFQTQLKASATLDVRGKQPKYAFKTDTQKVPVGDVLLAFTGNDRLSGTGSVNADITTAGERLTQFKQNLNGRASVNLADGAVKGFNLAQSIRQAKAKIAGEKASGSPEELKTDFSSLISDVVIKNGVIDTRKLYAKAPFMRVDGLGQVDLVKEKLDYVVKTKIVGSDKGQGGAELKELSGLTIPVKLKGDLKKPKVSLDLGSLLEQKAKQEVEKRVEEQKQQIEKQIEKQKEDTQKKLEEELKGNLLKGFGF